MIKMDNPPKTELVALDIEGPICRITSVSYTHLTLPTKA